MHSLWAEDPGDLSSCHTAGSCENAEVQSREAFAVSLERKDSTSRLTASTEYVVCFGDLVNARGKDVEPHHCHPALAPTALSNW
jgi:hypothetical protein